MGCRTAVLATTTSQTDVESAIRNTLNTSVADADNTEVCRVTVNPTDFSSITSGTEVTTMVEVDFAEVSWLPSSFLSGVALRGEASGTRE
jgi:hypothetical protein